MVAGDEDDLLGGEAEFGCEFVEEEAGGGVFVGGGAVRDVAGEDEGVELGAGELVVKVFGELAVPEGGIGSVAEVEVREVEDGGGGE